MGCGACGHSQSAPVTTGKTITPQGVANQPQGVSEVPTLMAGLSATTNLVHLRYKGGGMASKRVPGRGCKSCGGSQSRYQVVTTEQIMFVSEDAPNGIFKKTFTVSHDYWVTEEQAKLLLSMTYKDMAGKEKHKFEEIK